MTKRRLIGYATTNSNGVATLNYVGQGLGELDIVAEKGGGMLFHYIGTGGTETDSFVYNTTDIQVSTSSTGTTISNTGSVGRTYWANKSGTSTTGTNVDADWNAPFTVEFDVISYTGSATGIAFQIGVSTPSTIAVSKNFNDLGITSNNHIKVVYDGTTIKYYVDGVLKFTNNFAQSDVFIRFYIVNGNGFTYKNFFVYRGSSSLVSEPYEVWDTIKYDNGTDPNHNIWSVSSDASIDYSSGEYALFSKTATGNKYAQCTLSEQSVCFEFEVYQATGYRTSTFFRVSSSTEPLYSCQLQNISHYTSEWVKCRLTIINGNITFEDVEDSTKKHTSTYTGSLASFQFSLIGSDFTSMRFKNFKVYSI